MPDPLRTEPYLASSTEVAAWAHAVEELRAGGTFWLASRHPDGRPHLAPVLAVWADDGLRFATDPSSRKGRNLAGDRNIALSTSGARYDIVVDGIAREITNDAPLRRTADAYRETYGWEVEVADGRLHGDGAPTAGGGPFVVHELFPRTAFGFPRDGELPATRWRFT